VRQYIQNQEKEDKRLEQLEMVAAADSCGFGEGITQPM
jgi:hypothetical protein